MVIFMVLIGVSALSAADNSTVQGTEVTADTNDVIATSSVDTGVTSSDEAILESSSKAISTVNDNSKISTNKIRSNSKSLKNDANTTRNTYYVSLNGSSKNDGLTPSTAYDFKSVFGSFPNGETKFNNSVIIVQEGVYNINGSVAPQGLIYTSSDNCGNFVLDVIGNGTVVFNGQTGSTIWYNIASYSSGSSITLNNIKFTNGTAFLNTGWFSKNYKYGGALYNRRGNLTVVNCTFENNSANGTAYSLGGAITNYQGNLAIINSIFLNNFVNGTVTYGGAVANMAGTCTIENSTFKNNRAKATTKVNDAQSIGPIEASYAGAVGTYSSGTTYINGSTFINNTAGSGGAVGNVNSVTIVSNSTFTKNNAENGGAIGSYTSSYGLDTQYTIIENNTIINNTGVNGGGISVLEGNSTINGNVIANNTGVSGGAIAVETGNVTITKNTIVNNTAVSGAGIGSYEGNTFIAENTIANNKATSLAGAIGTSNGILTIKNNTIANNTAPQGGAVYNNQTTDILNNIFFNNTVTSENGYVVFNEPRKSITIVDNRFYNNTDFKRDMLFNDLTSERTTGNIYISNFLETNTDTKLENVTIPADYSTTITIDIRDVYNDTVRNGNITVYINGKKYNTYEVKDGASALITIPKSDLGALNNLVFEYTSSDLSYQPLNLTATIISIRNTKITVNANDTNYGNKTSVVTKLVDEDGNPVANANVVLYINGKAMMVTTDSEGSYTYELVTDNLDVNTVVAIYNGDAYYRSSYGVNTFNVYRLNTTTSVIIPKTTVGDDATIKGKLVDQFGTPIANADMVLIINGTNYAVKTDENGSFTYNIPGITNNTVITAVYSGNKTYAESLNSGVAQLVKRATIVTIDPIKGIIGEKITLTAHVIDEKGNSVSGGNLVFKLNGKTLRIDGSFNSTASPLKFKVVNGTVEYTMIADLYLRNAKNITATYSGSSACESNISNVAEAQIAKRSATIKVTTINYTLADKDIVFTANITDVTPHAENVTAVDNGGYVIFKINGKTLKDETGSPIKVAVENNTASYVYHVPAGTASVDANGNLRSYTVTALYINDIFYPNTRNVTAFSVEKSPINIQFGKVVINNNTKTLSIKGNITDYNNNLLVGTNKVCVKVNGVTIKDENNKTIYYTVNNGNIDLSNISVSNFKKYNNVMIVTGDRQAYLEGRNSTSNITIED